MKKILIVIPILLSGALLAPAFAGVIIKKRHSEASGKKRKIAVHERQVKNLDWVNYQTAQQFALDFPDAANVHWRQGNFEEATFTDGGIITTAYYDSDKNLVGTTTEASYSDLPEKAQKEIRKNFPDYEVTHVIFFKDNPDNDTDMFLYSTPFEDHDDYFAEISNGVKKIILKIDMDGLVSFFQNL